MAKNSGWWVLGVLLWVAPANAEVMEVGFVGKVIDTMMWDEVSFGDECHGSFAIEREVEPWSQGGDNAVYYFQGDVVRRITATAGERTHAPPPAAMHWATVDDDVDGDFFQFRAMELVGFGSQSTFLQFVETTSHAFDGTELPTFENLHYYLENGEIRLVMMRGAAYAQCEVAGLESIQPPPVVE